MSSKEKKEVKKIERNVSQDDLARIRAGARVKIYEEKKAPFEGIVIARKHGNEAGATFTVRAIISDIAVEKIFPLHTPAIKKIEIVSSPKNIKRAKLYFIRNLSAKKVRQKLRKVLAR